MQIGEIKEDTRGNLVELVRAAYEVEDVCWDYLWGPNDPVKMRVARIGLGKAVARMYQLYQEADFDCPQGLERSILIFREQLDVIEVTLEADEINKVRGTLKEALQGLHEDLKVLADKLDIDLDASQEEEIIEEKKTFLGVVLGVFGIRRK